MKDPIGFDSRVLNLYAYSVSNPIGKVDPSGLVDIFVTGEADAVGGIGIEFGGGFVLDTDDIFASGAFSTAGLAGGANAGYGIGFGCTLRDIEGSSLNLDVNVGPASISYIVDDLGLNGFAFTVGPGIGVSVSATDTRTFSIRDALSSVNNLLSADEISNYGSHGCPLRYRRCIQ